MKISKKEQKKILKDLLKATKKLRHLPTRREYRNLGKSSRKVEDSLGSWGKIRSLRILKMLVK